MINYSENQKMNNKDYDCRGVFQSFKVKKVSKFQSLKVLKFQSFKVKKGKYQRRGTARRAPTNLEFQRIAVPLQIRNFNVLPCPYKVKKVSKFQSFKVSKFQSFKVSKFQSFKVSK